MNYPLISEYIEAIKSAEDNFKELTNLRPVLGDDGLPVMSNGNFAVVFKMQDEESGKFYAVKCFTKEQEGRAEAYREIAKELENVSSSFILSIRYLEKELFVDTDQTTETEFPVLLMDWVEGKTLDKYLRENFDDKYALEMLAYRFSQLAQWLIPQPFAHGDLKPDNILVRADGTLVLVDYDGMYVPAMRGQKARELGSPDFRHPLRTEDDFDEHIDDFPLVSILLSLKAISINPQLLEEYGAADRLLFSSGDYYNILDSECYRCIISMAEIEVQRIIVLLFLIIKGDHVDNYLSFIEQREPYIGKYTEVTDEDLIEPIVDEFGAMYSKDGTRLLKGVFCNNYKIREGTVYICDWAFHSDNLSNSKELIEVDMPDSVKVVGVCSFLNCHALNKVRFSQKLVIIQKSAFEGCESMENVVIPDTVFSIGESVFQYCSKLKKAKLPKLIKSIECNTFGGCSVLEIIDIPPSVVSIEHMAFEGCSSLSIFIPSTVKTIKGNIGCHYTISPNSTYLLIEDGVLYNKEKSVIYCFDCFDSMYNYKRGKIMGAIPKWAEIDNRGERINEYADEYNHIWTYNDYIDVLDIVIPDSIESIEDYSFWGVHYIRSIVVPKSVQSIGYRSFSNCEIHLPINLCSPDVINLMEYSGHIIVPKGCEDNLLNFVSNIIFVDYEEFIFSKLCNFFPKEELFHDIEYYKSRFHSRFLRRHMAISLLSDYCQYLVELLEESKENDDYKYKNFINLLEHQKNELEEIKNVVKKDKY